MSNALPAGWEVSALSDLSTVITKGTTPTTNGYPYTKSGVKFLRVENISKGGKILEHDLKFISEEANKSLSRSQLKAHDLLISIAGAIGRSATVEERHLPANTNQAIGIVRLIKGKVENDYIRFSFESPIVDKQIKDSQSGLAQINLNLEQLGSLRINLPPLPEQQKIAAILTAVDHMIESTQAHINKLKDLKTGMMQELLTKGIGHTEFKDSPVGRIPKAWEVKALPDVANNLDSKRVPIKSTDRANMKGGYRYYGASGIIDYVNDYIFDGEYILLGEDGENVLSRNLPLAFIVKGKSWVNNHAHVIEAKIDTDLKFLCEYLESLDYKNIASGSAQPKITQGALNEILIPMPSIEEQKKISKILSSLDEKLALKIEQLNQTQKLKKALMQDLLTGKVRVKVN